MATLNLGRIKPVFRGAYAGGTAYVVDDIVTSGNETFICILASTGNATSNATYWTKLAAKGTDGTDLTSTLTTQGDIVYRDGSGLARLGFGTVDHVLTTKGTGANPVWAAAGGGNLGQVIQTTYATQVVNTTADHDIMTMASITPASSSSRFLININLWLAAASNPNGGMVLYRNSTALLVHATQQSATDTFWSSNESIGGLTSAYGMENFNWSYIDSPATASAIVYKLSAQSISDMTYNRAGNGADQAACTSTMIVSELLS